MSEGPYWLGKDLRDEVVWIPRPRNHDCRSRVSRASKLFCGENDRVDPWYGRMVKIWLFRVTCDGDG